MVLRESDVQSSPDRLASVVEDLAHALPVGPFFTFLALGFSRSIFLEASLLFQGHSFSFIALSLPLRDECVENLENVVGVEIGNSCIIVLKLIFHWDLGRDFHCCFILGFFLRFLKLVSFLHGAGKLVFGLLLFIWFDTSVCGNLCRFDGSQTILFLLPKLCFLLRAKLIKHIDQQFNVLHRLN